jgi:hypothetical protein
MQQFARIHRSAAETVFQWTQFLGGLAVTIALGFALLLPYEKETLVRGDDRPLGFGILP